MALPQKLSWEQAQTVWASQLNPLLANVLVNGIQALNGITLNANTAKTLSHGLNRQPQGWFLTDLMSNAVVWRTAWNAQTITLEASADTTVSVWVF